MNSIGDYFSEHIVDELINQMKESIMYSAMVSLIRDSDLDDETKQELLQGYEDGDRAEFPGRAFLYALVGDNLKKDPDVEVLPIDEDIRTFKELVKKSHKKPTKILHQMKLKPMNLTMCRNSIGYTMKKQVKIMLALWIWICNRS